MRHFFVLVFFVFMCSTACKFNPNLQGEGTNYMQGVWHETSMPYQKQLLQHTIHNFRFTCDSFYIKLKTIARVNTYPDSCYNSGVWSEYAKGTYFTQNDTLVLKGVFTKSNFKQKISGCYRSGTFNPIFIISEKKGVGMVLQNLQNHSSVILKLKEKTTCKPQPLN
ncbi:MAG TPA: hypothetical protein VNI52_07735 [Sphingobacteriaceae bacterium]|nr:hypothetical protein [Sphingobacteriaceae bacterium]